MSSPWVRRTCAGSFDLMRAIIMNRGRIELWTRIHHFMERLKAAAPSSHDRFSLDFTTDIAESSFRYTQVRDFVKRILDGANSGDLPIEQPTRIQLFVNAKSAAVLGTTRGYDFREGHLSRRGVLLLRESLVSHASASP